ncbi:MAG: acetate--CoA ligase family protein [Candidatus Moraniibacteriota bacterium]
MQKNLEKLFNPANVAIVGASDREGSVGNAITKNLLELGYRGEVFLVNPKYQELLGRKCYRDLNEIETEIDLAVVAIPAGFVNETVKNAQRVKNFIVISAGFSEIGDEGKNREKELLKIAEEKEVNVLGPNCLGFIAPGINLNASFAAGMPEGGSVSLISQSGALMVAMLDMAKEKQIRFAQILSVGNKMQLSEVELLEYLENDAGTEVIALYLEGIKDGQKFIQTAQRVGKNKPVIVLKAGRSEKAQKAIASHTGSLAGSDEIMDVAFEKAGIIRAESLEDFFILITLFSNYKEFANPHCAIVTNAGGPGVLATDAFKNKHIKLKDFNPETKDGLKSFLPAESSVENPIDVLGDADEERYRKTLEVLEKEDLGSIICLMTAQGQTPVSAIAEVVRDFYFKSEKNIIPVFIGEEKIEAGRAVLREARVPGFEFSEELIEALDKTLKSDKSEKKNVFADFLKQVAGQIFSKAQKNDLVKEAFQAGRKALLFGEAGKLMKNYGIPVIDFVDLHSGEDFGGEISFPAVLKVDSESVLHKTEKRGLILGIKSDDELKREIAEMRNNFPNENLIVQPMLNYEAELILGLKRDSVFGPVIVFGLGGIYTEIFRMVDFLILPLTEDEIRKKVERSKVGFLFRETRGKKIADLEEFVKLINNFAKLVQENEEIKEIDINPLLVTKGGELKAVDVKVIF